MPLFDPANVSAIPLTMQICRCWVNWRYETRKGKQTKVPLNPWTGHRASSTDPATWGTFEQVVDNAQKNPTWGIGFVFEPPWVGIDLDYHEKTYTGDLTKFQVFAAEVLTAYLDTYAEFSPSGVGIHIYTQGQLTKALKTPLGEMYTQGRFFTVTGNVLPGHPSEVSTTGPSILARTARLLQRKSATAPVDAVTESAPETAQDAPSVDFDPDDTSAPDLILFESLCDMQPRFRGIWDKKRKPEGTKGDTSDSAYEMSLARQAAQERWSDQDIYRLLVAWRSKHNLPPKHLKALQATIAKARETVEESKKDQQLEDAVDLPDESRLGTVRELLGLDIVEIIQMGRDEGQYRLVLSDKTVIPLGAYVAAWKVSLWERLAFEHAHKVVQLSAKRWTRVIALLRSLVRYEESGDTGADAEMYAWLSGYLRQADSNAYDYESVTAQKPFKNTTGTYLYLSSFLTHIGIRFANRLPRATLANRLRSLGWEETIAQAKEDVTGDVCAVPYWVLRHAVSLVDGRWQTIP